MPTFNISDITPAGAYANAVTAATDSDRRNPDRCVATGESTKVEKFVNGLIRRIAGAIVEKRPAAGQRCLSS